MWRNLDIVKIKPSKKRQAAQLTSDAILKAANRFGPRRHHHAVLRAANPSGTETLMTQHTPLFQTCGSWTGLASQPIANVWGAADRMRAGTVEGGFILRDECISRIIKFDSKQTKTNQLQIRIPILQDGFEDIGAYRVGKDLSIGYSSDKWSFRELFM
jgi:hypothetical protein